ncbi:mannitol dehydrogenase family protein, partial [Staphylococcus pasteuri]
AACNFCHGFIAYVLSHNNIKLTFPHVNHQIINPLQTEHEYHLILPHQPKTTTTLNNLHPINSPKPSHQLKQPILQPHLITTPLRL